MSVRLFPAQLTPTTPVTVPNTGNPVFGSQSFLLQIWNRTGAGTGNPLSVGSNLTAAGSSSITAPQLFDDFNEILLGSGGVMLFTLQPGQSQEVFNGTGAPVNVYPAPNGQINAIAVNGPYSLAAGASEVFTCYKLLASGAPFYRTLL